MQRKEDQKSQDFSLKPAMKRSRGEGTCVSLNYLEEEAGRGPPSTKAFDLRPPTVSTFRKMCDRGDLPVQMDYNSRGYRIFWKVAFDKLDYNYYLPLFFDGLTETGHPFNFFASQGIHEMLEKGGPKILPVIPQLIIPIRKALNTRNHAVMCSTLRVLKRLVVSGDNVGEALVPYFRQILPVFRMFHEKNSTENVVFGQRGENISELIRETLELLELHGGMDALLQIKYVVPTYK